MSKMLTKSMACEGILLAPTAMQSIDLVFIIKQTEGRISQKLAKGPVLSLAPHNSETADAHWIGTTTKARQT